MKESFRFNANGKKKYFNSIRSRDVQIFKKLMPDFQLVNIYRYKYFKIVFISYLEKVKYYIFTKMRSFNYYHKKKKLVRKILLEKLEVECQEGEEKNIIYLSTSTTTYLKSK